MDLRILALLVLFSAVGITEASLASCCSQTGTSIPMRLLKKINKFDIQKSDGICDIKAVILHYRRKKFCADPENSTLKKWIRHKSGRVNRKHRRGMKNRRRNGKRKLEATFY
ncbi:C-C motif chemokine 28-like [Polyodon spathula]|uniref:C-C motif chemokine 28-like n=1 Tax=Polyodon spathula TaxID=7913 RepID=UPI001B7EECA0|nr:C-C motif chemokine 28-like [Polyodon spathula]